MLNRVLVGPGLYQMGVWKGKFRRANPSFPKERIILLYGDLFRPPHPAEAGRCPQKKANLADAFCPEAPCPMATNQAFRKCQPASGGPPGQSRGFTLGKLTGVGLIGGIADTGSNLKERGKESNLFTAAPDACQTWIKRSFFPNPGSTSGHRRLSC